MNKSENKIIEISNLSFAYNKAPALQNINFEIEKGDYVGIIGPNGGGKTTLIKIILGLLKPQKGKIKVYGKEPGRFNKKFGYVAQQASNSIAFPLTVEEVVLQGLIGKNSYLPFWNQKQRKEVLKVMEELKIHKLKEKNFVDLSGGQQQRVRIARALVSSPEVLILDEPASNVDSTSEKDMYEFLAKLNNEGITIILVSHDIGAVSNYVNRTACINLELFCKEGKITDEKEISKLYQHNVRVMKHKCKL